MLNDRPSGNFGICISTSASTLAGSDIGVAEFFFFFFVQSVFGKTKHSCQIHLNFFSFAKSSRQTYEV